MTVVLIIIAVLLFLIADHIGVFSKNQAILPLLGFCALAYFYPIAAAATVVGVFWCLNFLATLSERKRKWKYQPQIDALFAKYGSPLPLEHHDELRRLHYLMRHGNLEGYKTEMQEVQEIVDTKFGGRLVRVLGSMESS
jgi:hypothetical protein